MLASIDRRAIKDDEKGNLNSNSRYLQKILQLIVPPSPLSELLLTVGLVYMPTSCGILSHTLAGARKSNYKALAPIFEGGKGSYLDH
jgi:hypothetical protein